MFHPRMSLYIGLTASRLPQAGQHPGYPPLRYRLHSKFLRLCQFGLDMGLWVTSLDYICHHPKCLDFVIFGWLLGFGSRSIPLCRFLVKFPEFGSLSYLPHIHTHHHHHTKMFELYQFGLDMGVLVSPLDYYHPKMFGLVLPECGSPGYPHPLVPPLPQNVWTLSVSTVTTPIFFRLGHIWPGFQNKGLLVDCPPPLIPPPPQNV